ncbi:uncharacterized protein LOC129915104 [Episyrphus balteatus]|uniref:uncharacterized protein LOC129915104 n=1 Tax=Episyrphus balteatus TaxID=286459 RepID=UPI002486993D|nr:uncharacterized protein LOC129915104 [Episyrphus balteatus]
MLLSKVILFSLFCEIKTEQNSSLSQTIHRAIEESHPSTIYFVDFGAIILSNYFQKPFNIPVIILNTISLNEAFKSVDENIILVIQVSSSFSNFHHLVNQIRVRRFVIVYGNSLEELWSYFVILWKECFTRIFGIAANITYAYLPFDDNPIKELLLSNEISLPNSLKDLNGFTFRTYFFKDIPRVFWYTEKNGQRNIGGYAGQAFLGFLKKHNATFVETEIKYFEPLNEFINATLGKTIDMYMNVFETYDGFEHSYPIKFLKWGILVPLNGFVDSSQYFLKPFQPTVWMTFGLLLLYLIITDFLKDYISEDSSNVWKSFSKIFLIFLYMPSEKPITKSYWYHLQILIAAFICVNFYLIYMTSFLTVFIKVQQFESIQDLIENKFPVLMNDVDYVSYLKLAYKPDKFENIIVVESYKSFVEELNSMTNTSFAYAVGSDNLKFLMDAQIKPKFHIIEDNLQQYFMVFLFAKNSVFKEILSDFIIQIFTTGLIDQWTRNAYYQAKNEGYIYSDMGHVFMEQDNYH